MDFGIFMEFEVRTDTQAAAFQEGFRMVDLAEQWGLDIAWLGEMHFSPARSVLSAPIAVASAIAARTRRLRVGTAVQVLPLSNPLRIAEEAATLDHISGGRFDFGIGRSGFPRIYDIYGVPYAESQARFHEALEIILTAWKGEAFDYAGEFYKFRNAHVAPRPCQLPAPAAPDGRHDGGYVPARGADGAAHLRRAPRHGHSGPQALSLRVPERLARSRAPGDGDVCLRIPVYAAPTEQEARDEPYETFSFYFSRQAELTKGAVGREGTGAAESQQARVDRLAGLSYDEILEHRVAVGSPSGLVDRLCALREDLGLSGIAAELNSGGMLSPAQSERTLRIMTQEVMPAFK